MLYFSEIQGKKVYTSTQDQVGRLEDLIFLASEKPKITKLVVKDNGKKILIIPIEFLKKANNEIILDQYYQTADLAENELYVFINLMDNQIIDIGGNKLVRVNDVAIQQEKNHWQVVGVDIGFLGVLRWLKVEDIVLKLLKLFNLKITSKFLSWAEIQPLQLTKGRVKLKKPAEKLLRLQPEDLADHLEKTNLENTRKILGLLDEEYAAEVIGSLNVNYQIDVFHHFPAEKAADILEQIDPDEAVDILLALPIKKQSQIFPRLTQEKRRELTHLINLSQTTIGGLMTTEFVTALSTDTVEEVIRKIKKETDDFDTLDYIYVVNSRDQLVGVFNLHELLMQKPTTPIYKFMGQNVVVIHLSTPEEIAIKKLLKYQLYALPVIDTNKKILGVVTLDDLSGFLENKLI